MTTVCDGWKQGAQHARIVLKDDGKNDGMVSHGMCDACQQLLNDEMDGDQKGQEFEAYRTNPTFDPRD